MYDLNKKSNILTGLVISKHRSEIIVEDSSKQRFSCSSRKKLPTIVSGDNILWQKSSSNQGVITEICKRSSLLTRPDNNGNSRPIAANITQMLIVAAIEPKFNFDLIENYLIAAELLKITPIIIINKIDLLSETQLIKIKNDFTIYRHLKIKLFFISSRKEIDMRDFITQLENNISIFVGQSGVGKSSLINKLIPELNLQTRPLSDNIKLGKHTTSVTTLYHHSSTGKIIDSPGVREFKLWKIKPIEAANAFPEFRTHLGKCKYRDCIHKDEPNCAIKSAVTNGDIFTNRYLSYIRLITDNN